MPSDAGMLIFLHLIQVTSSLYVNSFLRTNAFYSTLASIVVSDRRSSTDTEPSLGCQFGCVQFRAVQCS